MTFIVNSDREAGITVLQASTDNLNGGQLITHDLPAGFGDCWIHDVMVLINDIATLMATPEVYGPRITLVDASGAFIQDLVSAPYWVRAATSTQERLSAWGRLTQPIFMRTLDLVSCQFNEVDTDASPTADFIIVMRVMRIRNMPVAGAEPPLLFTS